MTDLIKRLRARQRVTTSNGTGEMGGAPLVTADPLCIEAAEEIESTRELLRLCRAERDDLAAKHYENERLRELNSSLTDKANAYIIENARLAEDAERWRYWRNYWPALCRMEVAQFARIDLTRVYVQSPSDMDAVTDAAMNVQP